MVLLELLEPLVLREQERKDLQGQLYSLRLPMGRMGIPDLQVPQEAE